MKHATIVKETQAMTNSGNHWLEAVCNAQAA
jgi:hypothetical protein